jgi:septal ring factor EnvC (AmiA/AmiB activator)
VAAGNETLYLELRHRGEAIDPAQWFDMTGQ